MPILPRQCQSTMLIDSVMPEPGCGEPVAVGASVTPPRACLCKCRESTPWGWDTHARREHIHQLNCTLSVALCVPELRPHAEAGLHNKRNGNASVQTRFVAGSRATERPSKNTRMVCLTAGLRNDGRNRGRPLSPSAHAQQEKRRGGDSNSRTRQARYWFSRPAHSAALAPLPRWTNG